jgi:predicted ATPase
VVQQDNPYASALDGLIIEDPVTAFFDFCRERENIRLLRESGKPPPWSEDPVFQQGRFLNVFREDDRVSKSILKFADSLSEDLPALIQAVFFARWCNKASTLDSLNPGELGDPGQLATRLEASADQPWCNVTAYPVEPVQWEGKRYSRLDSATHLFAKISMELTDLILKAEGDVIRATSAVNQRFCMANDFPVFMAIIDLAWFRPDVIDPGSPVPTGIGAVAYLDRLQEHLGLDSHQQTCEKMIELQPKYWPEAKRQFQPIDIEYLSCENRKYHSYIHGTKQFEGKNVFEPGSSPRFIFDVSEKDVPDEEIQTQICVLAGGPCSGKSTLLKALADEGHHTEYETAERLLKAGIAAGQSVEEMRADPVEWQEMVCLEDFKLFDGLAMDQLVFTDTSFLETLVFANRAGISMGPNIEHWLRTKRYLKVFFLDSLADYARSEVRMESVTMARQISEQVRDIYQHYGYELVRIPDVSIEERTAMVNSALAGTGT